MNTLDSVFAKSLLLITLCLTQAFAGCGGGSNSNSTSSSTSTVNCANPTAQDTQGCVYVAMTDDPGDFLTYTVNVSALSLIRADGVTVQTLPQSTSVDFAQYSNLTEFLTGVSMPPGNYVSGSITLDYSTADIQRAACFIDACITFI